MKKVDEVKTPWHLLKIDHHAYGLIKKKRDEMQRRGQHASYSDAIRELILISKDAIDEFKNG